MKKSSFKLLMVFVFIVISVLVLVSCSERQEIKNPFVNFETNGGTTVNTAINGIIETPPMTTKKGYLLEGWYFDKEFEKRVEFPYYAGIVGTIYAKWTSIEKGNADTEYVATTDGNAFVVKKINDSAISVVIPDFFNGKPVEIIDASCLKNKKSIINLYIGKSVKTISENFHICPNLQAIEVSINNTVYAHNDGVLYNKNKTELILYPQGKRDKEFTLSVDTVRENAFYNNSKLVNIVLSKDFNGEIDFTDLNKLEKITVNAGNDTYFDDNGILYSYVDDGYNLVSYPANNLNKDYRILENTRSVEENAFAYSQLETVAIPSTLVDDNLPFAFGLAHKLSAVSVDELNSNFSAENGVLYNKDFTRLLRFPIYKSDTSFIIKNTVLEIESFAFEYVVFLEELTISNQLLEVGDYAFCEMERIKKVVFEEKSNISSLGKGVFLGCDRLREIVFTSRFLPEIDGWFLSETQTPKIVVPSNAYQIYKDNWAQGANLIIGEGVALETFTVTFDVQQGTDVSIEGKTNFYHGVYLTYVPTVTREGHVFLGWYYNKQGVGEKISFPYVISSHVTIYAVWDIAESEE